MISKVSKEKKMLQELQQKTAEDLQVAEDKNNHLTYFASITEKLFQKYFFTKWRFSILNSNNNIFPKSLKRRTNPAYNDY
jgi:hypothetical protein